jgi:hypothetical protein
VVEVVLLFFLHGWRGTRKITTSRRAGKTVLVEDREPVVPATVEQIRSLQCWMACLVLLLRILPLCCVIFHCRLRAMLQEFQWRRQYKCSVLYVT